MSCRSASLIYSRSSDWFGMFTPLRLLTLPPFTTMQRTSSSVVPATLSRTRPSSIRMDVPRLTCDGSALYVVLTLSFVPGHSSDVSVNSSPSSRISLPFSKSPRRISGPFVSSSIAAGRSCSSRTRRKVSIVLRCSSCVP